MAPTQLIQARTLRGFRDHLPEAMIPREWLIETAKEVCRSFGFSPIDTPALEYAEILTGKGGEETDKQLYLFEDHGGRKVGLRFDLTVPFARFIAQYVGELGTPFKRYHVGSVWRGEKSQRGRYREFLQCDFDTIGTESVLADTECALVIHELFTRIGFERFTIRVNDRRVLAGVLEQLELAQQAAPLLRALDKLGKVGRDKVAEEMVATAGASAAQAGRILDLADVSGSRAAVLRRVESLVKGSEVGRNGLERLRELCAGVAAAGVAEERLELDLSLARGLDYYTGTVYETVLDDLPKIGSCCGGGRYDDLASVYTKERLPGVGASLGLDRLLTAMEELGMLEARATSAQVFVPFFDESRGPDYLALAGRLRAAGLRVELYPEPRKLGAQLRYADRRGHRLAVIVGEDEWAASSCQLKDLATKTSEELALEDVADACMRKLAE